MIGFVVAGAMLMAANGRPSVITNPDWAAAPDAYAVAEAYPSIASELRIEGYGTISCQITLEGRAEACQVLGESPREWGFGDAAVQASKSFRFKPRTLDGAPIAGGVVRVPLHFKMPPDANAARIAAYRPPVVFEARLALGRRVMGLRGGEKDLRFGIQTVMTEDLAKAPIPVGAGPAFQSDLETIMRDTADALVPEVLEAVAREYAGEYSEAQMTRILALAAGPDGREKAIKASPLKDERVIDAEGVRLIATVRAAMCAKHPCDGRPPVILPSPFRP